MKDHREIVAACKAFYGEYTWGQMAEHDRAKVHAAMRAALNAAAAVSLSDPRENVMGPARDDTARAAARVNFPNTGTQAWSVVRALAARGARGATSEELAAELYPGQPKKGDSIRPRVTGLRDGGWVQKTGETRPTGNGGESDVHALTEAGQAKLAAMLGH